MREHGHEGSNGAGGNGAGSACSPGASAVLPPAAAAAAAAAGGSPAAEGAAAVGSENTQGSVLDKALGEAQGGAVKELKEEEEEEEPKEGDAPAKPVATLYVGNLPPEADEYHLMAIFYHFGPILNIQARSLLAAWACHKSTLLGSLPVRCCVRGPMSAGAFWDVVWGHPVAGS